MTLSLLITYLMFSKTDTDRQETQVAVNDNSETSHNDERDENTPSDFEPEMSFESHDTKTTTTTKQIWWKQLWHKLIVRSQLLSVISNNSANYDFY